ncbi:4539_t:CDS:2, partial [Racocetra fulgida]
KLKDTYRKITKLSKISNPSNFICFADMKLNNMVVRLFRKDEKKNKKFLNVIKQFNPTIEYSDHIDQPNTNIEHADSTFENADHLDQSDSTFEHAERLNLTFEDAQNKTSIDKRIGNITTVLPINIISEEFSIVPITKNGEYNER